MLGLYTPTWRIMDFSWLNADQQIVREMGWSLFSNSVMAITQPADEPEWCVAEDEEALHILSVAEKNPRHLKTFIASRSDRRLGAYFESLWQYFLENHSFYQILARNKQIFDGPKTLGALDFLIEDQLRKKIVHLELAVKFYLFLPHADGENLEKWIGPNPDDNLAIKYQHLLNHQLPLTQSPEAMSAFRNAGLPQPELRAAIVKGYLFSPLEKQVKASNPVSPECPYGYWLRFSQLHELESRFPDHRWRITVKQDWLDPLPTKNRLGLLTSAELNGPLEQTEQPQLITGKSAASVVEDAVRVFVASDDWPKVE